jgi:GNAT superfamily N-acetyltransferase
MINIRKATVKDVSILQNLDQQIFLSDQKYDQDLDMNWAKSNNGKKYFSTLLKNSMNICLIAEQNNLPIGHIILNPKDSIYKLSKSVEITSLGIDPKFRSQGIGSILIQKALEWVKINGFQKVYVNAYFKNLDGIKFYKKNGFSEIDLGLELTL